MFNFSVLLLLGAVLAAVNARVIPIQANVTGPAYDKEEFRQDCLRAIKLQPTDSGGEHVFSNEVSAGHYQLPTRYYAGICIVEAALRRGVSSELGNWHDVIKTMEDMNEFCYTHSATRYVDFDGANRNIRLIVRLVPTLEIETAPWTDANITDLVN